MAKKVSRFFPTNRGSDITTGRELHSLGKGWSARFEKVDPKYEIDVSRTYSSLRRLFMSLPRDVKTAQNKFLFHKLFRLTEIQRLITPFGPLLKEENFEDVSEQHKKMLIELFSVLPEQWEVLRYRKVN